MKRKMFILYHGRFPSEKAAALFAGKDAESFATNGWDVTLIVSRRKGSIGNDPFEYYGLNKSFTIVYLPVIDIPHIRFMGLSFWMSYLSFSLKSRKYIKENSDKNDVVYSNELVPLALIASIRKNCFYEMHDFPESKLWIFGRILSRLCGTIVHNHWKMNEIDRVFPRIDKNSLLCEPNAVDISKFDISISETEARMKLGLPSGVKLAVYTGHLYGWKGVKVLAEAAKLLPNGYLVAFVGGTTEDVATFRKEYGSNEKISIVGYVSHDLIPTWQKAADVLVLPNTAKEKISAFYTSPMKLFEYMASRRPVVASDIPSVRELIDPSEALLVVPDDAQDLARGITEAVVSTGESAQKIERAYVRVTDHTWEKRASRITHFINSRL